MGDRARLRVERAPGKLAGSAYGTLCRVVTQDGREHPEITYRRDALLSSINDRLGEVLISIRQGLALPARPCPGAALPALSGEWIDEMLQFTLAAAEEREEAMDEANGGG